MAEFTVNAGRDDPYKQFMFRIKWDKQYIAGLSKMSPLKRTTEPVIYHVGGDKRDRKSPGRSHSDAVTFERGLTHDPAFEDWANLVYSVKSPISLKRFRKEVIVDIFNEADQQVLSYVLHRCWVSEFQAVPAMDAGSSAVAIETLKIELESWERDISVTEPNEP
jgi:phage tail-like protein